MSKHKEYAEWRVHTQSLLQEVLNNPGTGILSKPLKIFAHLLAEVSERALEINDPELNALMCRLTLYEQADPYSKDYDKVLVRKTIEKGQRIKMKKKNKIIK